MAPLPSHEGLVTDLRTLRERGLLRLRDAALPALWQAVSTCHPGLEPVAAAERLIGDAAERLGATTIGSAASYTFGLVQGTRDWPASDRRRRAAQVYGISVERFRKHQERVVLAQLAEQILAICDDLGSRTAPHALHLAGRARVLVDAGRARVTVHVRPIELITGVDVLVSPENVYMEMSKTFKFSVSAALRRAGAHRSAAGEVLEDVVQLELNDWMAAHGRAGLPVAPGTVAPTGPGDLAANGVRRIYHAAVAVPRTGSNDYDVAPPTIAQVVRQVFLLGERERASFSPPLSSFCFPLVGTGRGRVPLEVGVRWLWTALLDNLDRHPRWAVHLSVPLPEVAEAVVRALSDRGAEWA